MIIVRCP